MDNREVKANAINSNEQSNQQKSFKSNIELHPTITPSMFVNNYIEELQEEVNGLSLENEYLQEEVNRLSLDNEYLQEENKYYQSDQYLDTILPTNYIQQLKDRIQFLEKKHEQSLMYNVTLTQEVNAKTTYTGYGVNYVQGLQEELTKLTEENFYLKSPEYKSKMTHSCTQHSQIEKEIMEHKIDVLEKV